jgi:hypothetical protein
MGEKNIPIHQWSLKLCTAQSTLWIAKKLSAFKEDSAACISGLIPQNLQLQAQVALASLG